jgi:hypothetical protein
MTEEYLLKLSQSIMIIFTEEAKEYRKKYNV